MFLSLFRLALFLHFCSQSVLAQGRHRQQTPRMWKDCRQRLV
jgi:hypothetical protein